MCPVLMSFHKISLGKNSSSTQKKLYRPDKMIIIPEAKLHAFVADARYPDLPNQLNIQPTMHKRCVRFIKFCS